jgi:hypothetical protein
VWNTELGHETQICAAGRGYQQGGDAIFNRDPDAWARFGLAQCKPAMIMILVGHGLLGPETGRFQKNDKNHAELCEIHKYCNIFPHWRDFHFLHLQLQHTSYG